MSRHVLTSEAQIAEKSLRTALVALRSAGRALREASDPIEAGAAMRALTREADHISSGGVRYFALLHKLPLAPTTLNSETPDAPVPDLLGIASTIVFQLKAISEGQATICGCGGLRPIS